MNNCVVIAGNGNRRLANKICQHLGVKLSDSFVDYFSNTESRPEINESVRGKHIFIVQTGAHNIVHVSGKKSIRPLSVNDHIVDTCLIADAVKRSGCKSVTLLMPCYPYARQDKKDKARACIAASRVARIFERCGIKRVVSTELHNPCIQGFFDASVDNLYTQNLIVDWLKTHELGNDGYANRYVVVAPDEGGMKRASVFADKLGLPFLAMSKHRDYNEKNKVSRQNLLGDPKLLTNRTVLILDDMLDTGGTIVKTIETLKQKGAQDVIVCVTHGILSGPAVDRINKCEQLKYLLTSDSLDQTHNLMQIRKGKLRVFTLSEMYAQVVVRLIKGQSISEIFE